METEIASPPAVPPSLINLSHKPGAEIAYRLTHHSQPSSRHTDYGFLIVFINGLMLPMSAWTDTINSLLQIADNEELPTFSILSYDRYGQGQTTARDLTDDASDLSHGHDILSSVIDLHHLISTITTRKLIPKQAFDLLFVAHSIGCPLARLYCAQYPRTVSALLLLASNVANSDILSIFPDPWSPTFSSSDLPLGVTVDGLLAHRDRILQTFHPNVGSSEGLSRRNLASLLPHSSSPKLLGPDGHGPFITVVNHGLAAFVAEGWKMNGTPKALNDVYMNPAWWRYNEGLCELTDSGRSRGPIEAVGSGHFVQRDRPDLVAAETAALLRKIRDKWH